MITESHGIDFSRSLKSSFCELLCFLNLASLRRDERTNPKRIKSVGWELNSS